MPYKTTSVFTETTRYSHDCETVTRTTVVLSDTKEKAAKAKADIMQKIRWLLGNKQAYNYNHDSDNEVQAFEQLIRCEINMCNLGCTKYQWTFTCEETD